MKGLAHSARCIVVMTEATAAMALSPDPGRRDIMWVPDFTEKEAREYLRKTKFASKTSATSLTKSEIDEIENHAIDRLGCRPVDLYDLTQHANPNYRAWIEGRIAGEKGKIIRLITDDKSYKKLVEIVLERGEIDENLAMRTMDKSIDAIAPIAMKKYHVFSYNPVTMTVFFHSKVMRHAAEQWMEEERKKEEEPKKEEERKKASWFGF